MQLVSKARSPYGASTGITAREGGKAGTLMSNVLLWLPNIALILCLAAVSAFAVVSGNIVLG